MPQQITQTAGHTRPPAPAGDECSVKFTRKAVRVVACHKRGGACSDVFACEQTGVVAPFCDHHCALDYFGFRAR